MIYQGLFLYKLYMVSFFLSVLYILTLILIIIAGVYHYKSRDPIRYSYLLTILGAISILWIVCIPGLLDALSFEPNMRIELIDVLIFYLFLIPISILSIFTFGGVFIFIGVKNRRSFGIYLRNSGILWSISRLLGLFIEIGLNGYTYVDYIPPADENVRIFLRITHYIVIALGILANVFLLIYAMKLLNLSLGVTAIVLIIGTLIAFIYDIYLEGIIYILFF